MKNGRRKHNGVSVLLLIFVIGSLIALCIGADALEKRNGWRVDASFNSISTHTEATRELLIGLKHDVHIWALFRKGNEDAPLLELLDRYAAENHRITWEQADPGLNPALVARFATAAETPEESGMIVYCEDTGRWRILGPADYVSLGMDMTTGEYSYAGWTYERSISEAIDYVSRDSVPQAVVIQGHGELDGETIAAFDSFLTNNRYTVTYRSLSDPDYMPDPGDLLVFFSPQRDLTGEELDKVNAFAAQGGSFLFARDFSDPTDRMPNYSALLRSYGFECLDGIVIADSSATGTYYNGEVTYLLPEMLSTDITVDLLASGADQTLLPAAAAFETPEETDRNLTVSAVLQSGDTSYLKPLSGAVVSTERETGDPGGPFSLALQARRVTSAGYISRAFIIGCSAAVTDEQLLSMTDMPQLLIRTMEFLMDVDASSLDIMDRTAIRPTLGLGSTGLGSVLVVALPAAVLFTALLVLVSRRRRHK